VQGEDHGERRGSAVADLGLQAYRHAGPGPGQSALSAAGRGRAFGGRPEREACEAAGRHLGAVVAYGAARGESLLPKPARRSRSRGRGAAVFRSVHCAHLRVSIYAVRVAGPTFVLLPVAA
jgi:hypothetical protein